MPQSKKTAPSQMSTQKLILEHQDCCDDVDCADKARRLRIKDELRKRALKRDEDAHDYAHQRRWDLRVAA